MGLIDDFEFADRVLKVVDLPTPAHEFTDPALGEPWETDALPEEGRYLRRCSKRQQLHLLQVRNAAKHIGQLPEAGESLHCVMRGNYNAWDLVPAVLKLAAPATIAELYVATLGFNKANAVELLGLIDAGQIGAVGFICSCYFRAADPATFSFLAEGLTQRRQRVIAMRNHAKLLLMRLSDGRSLVVESSANLRSCRNVEQFAMSHDAGLFDFHAAWMGQMFGAGA